MLDRMCEKLAKDWGVERGFGTSVPGIWGIPLDDDLEIVLAEINGGYTLSATLAQAPQEKREEFYVELLAANMAGQATKGAVLGLNEKENVVVSQAITRPVQYRDFVEILEDFVTTVDDWQAVIKKAASGG